MNEHIYYEIEVYAKKECDMNPHRWFITSAMSGGNSIDEAKKRIQLEMVHYMKHCECNDIKFKIIKKCTTHEVVDEITGPGITMLLLSD